MPSARRPEPTRSAGDARLLLLHRAAIVVLLVAVAGLGLALLRGSGKRGEPAGREPAEVIPPLSQEPTGDVFAVDLAQRVGEIARAGWPDGSETYFADERASVHMHVLGYGQRVPLHLHREGEEATIVVTGTPEVLHVYGTGHGTLVRSGGARRSGTLIHSPPFSAHKWVNHDAEHMQGNLVFSVPPFGGNLYVEEDDPRLLEGRAPTICSADSLLERLPDDEPYRLERLPIMSGRMSALVVRGEAELPAAPEQRVVYIAEGRASLPAGGGAEVKAHHLLVLPARRSLRLRAVEPTVAFVFNPAGTL